jgi:mono/diheme cytochrome c family protein
VPRRAATFLTLFLGACAGPRPPTIGAEVTPHLGEAWFAHRAATLGLSVEAARARDAALPTAGPPPALDDAVALEAAAVWRDVCAACHGPEGRPPPPAEGAPPGPEPKTWGTFGVRMGFLFGGDKMRAGIYRSIAEGKTTPDGQVTMPPWGAVLSREQLWGLVRHIEGL